MLIPSSSKVGTSGYELDLSLAATPITLILSSLVKLIAPETFKIHESICPPKRATMDEAEPSYGTFSI